MARPGLYRSDVEKARLALLSRGLNPSIDLVRSELGNTGSRSTIHRFLKEIEAESAVASGEKIGLSDVLTALVSRLAEQLQQEANAIVADGEARHRAEQARSATALDDQRKEAANFAASLQHCEVALAGERETHDATRRELAEARLSLASQTARLDGLLAQLEERDQRITSLEDKHAQAREALEHFRTAAKEQREQELRRHDHAIQAVQVELRHAGDALTAKNHELQQLHRDNGRLLEQNSANERELNRLQSDLRAADDRRSSMEAELSALRAAIHEHAAIVLQRDHLAQQLGRAEASLQGELTAHGQVVAERDRLIGRIQGLEEIVKRIEQRPAKRAGRQAPLPLDESPQAD